MADKPEDLTSLLIPMKGRPWLLPNIVVAEVIPLRHPDRPGQGQDWHLGWISWRDLDVPLISFERLSGLGPVAIGEQARLAVMNAVGSSGGFYALVIQGIPRQVRVSAAELVVQPGDAGPMAVHAVQSGGELALIPDLDAVEQAVRGLHGRR